VISRGSIACGYPTSPLGAVAEFLDSLRRPVKESERRSGPYPYYGANGLQGKIDGYIFDEPLVLLAEDGGHFDDPDRGVAYLVSGKCWVNNHAHVLRARPEMHLGFLFRVLENYDLSPFVSGTTRGKLTQAGASEIPIPIPPIGEQRRIAALLDQGDLLRRQRRLALEQLGGIARAVFQEMFGGDSSADRTEPLGDHLSFITSGGRNWARFYAPTGSRFIRSLDVRMNFIGNDDVVFVRPPENAEARRTRVESGDVLLTITGSRIGRVASVPNELAGSYVSQHVAILRPKTSILARFLSFYLSVDGGGQRQIAKAQYGQTKPGLNFEQIKRFNIPVPPISLQARFVTRTEDIDVLRTLQRAHLAKLDALFAGLQDRAFRGELMSAPTPAESAELAMVG
jgi:type I restriction enzyme, S subunit